jgi:death-on-curing protein
MQRGGLRGIHSFDLIDAAIARPYSGYYRTLAAKCAALVQSTAGNHGFIDGNKRTTLILVNLLLQKSGYHLIGRVSAQHNTEIEQLILSSVRHEIDFDAIAAWFKDRIVPID